MGSILHAITSWGVPVLILFSLLRVAAGESLTSGTNIYTGFMVVAFLASRLALQKGHFGSTLRALLLLAWTGLTCLTWLADGTWEGLAIGYLTVTLVSGLLLGMTEAFFFLAASVIAIWGITYLNVTGNPPPANGADPFTFALKLTFNFSLGWLVLFFIIRTLRKSLETGDLEIRRRKAAETALQQQAAYLNALHETTLGIVNRLELRPLLDSILTRACELVDTRHALIELVVPDGSALRLELGRGIPAPYEGYLTPKGRGMTGTVWATGKTQFVEDYSTWEHRIPEVNGQFHATVGLPLKSGGEVIGVLALMCEDPHRRFEASKVDLLERFASLASLAIQNARLYEGAQRELSERRLVEAALRESEERFRMVFSSSPIPILISSLQEGRVLDANSAYWQLTGLEPGETVGKTQVELKFWPGEEERRSFVEKLKEKRSFYDPDNQFVNANGELKTVLAFYEVVQIGGQDCVLSMFNDMSAQKQTVDALRESESRNRVLLEAIPDMIMELTIDGLITNMIPPTGMEASMPVEAYVNRRVDEVFSATAASQTLFALDRSLSTGHMNVFEFREKMADEEKMMEARVVPSSHNTALMMIRDITQRRWVETEREKLINELEDKNRESETLRESLASIAGTFEFSEIIQRVLEQIQLVVPYDSASVWRLERKRQILIGGRDLPAEIAATTPELIMDEANSALAVVKGLVPYTLNGNVQQELADFQNPPHTYVNSWLAVPLAVKGNIIGLISLDGRQKNQFTEHHAELAVAFANQVAIALENATLFSNLQDELEQRKALITELELKNIESETLRESSAIVTASLEKKETIDRILEQLERVVPFDSASVQLVEGDMLQIVSEKGFTLDGQEEERRFPIDENEPAYPVLRGLAPYVLLDDVQPHAPAFRVPPHDRIHAWLAVPLKVKREVVGVIALDGYRVGQFTERHAQLAVTYANQVAIALENARLYSDLQSDLAIRQTLISELESKNAELERFTYTVSHDLKSPLFTIRGFLGYLEQDALSGDHQRLRSDMQRIVDATERMQQLLNDLLELSRIGRLINEPSLIPFGELAREAVALVQGRIMENGVTVHIADDLPDVYGDRPRLIEVVQNLVDNAAKFTGGRRNSQIEIGCEGWQDGKPVLYVRDNGIGIPPQHHERIFGLFNKLDVKVDGTGIGLALVKRIVEVHGGRIWVQSEQDRGATFYFTLPGASGEPQTS